MEEEKKEELVVAEQPQEEPKAEAQPQQSGLDEVSKYSLISFILAVIGLSVCGGWMVGSIAGIVLGIIALSRCKNNAAVKQPFRTFDRITKPVAIVSIVLGAILTVVFFITFCIKVVTKVVDALDGDSVQLALNYFLLF